MLKRFLPKLQWWLLACNVGEPDTVVKATDLSIAPSDKTGKTSVKNSSGTLFS